MRYWPIMRKVSLIFIFILIFFCNTFADYQIKSDDIRVDTSNFNNNLSSLDDTVQKALDTLDDMLSGGGGMIYPESGIPISTGSGWGTSITDNHTNWDSAYSWGNHAAAGYALPINSPTKNYALLWDGSQAIWAPQGTSFTFSIASFSSAQSSPQLIGSGTWKAAGSITFTASYNNGPATDGYVSKTGWSNLTLTNSYQGPTVSAEAVDYPAAPGTSITFTLHATDGVDPTTSTSSVVFYNYRFYGVTSKPSGYTEEDIEALTGALSNSRAGSFTVTAETGEYIVYAYPARLGEASFWVGGFEGGFQSPETVSVTNSAGYTEDYYIYRSTNSGLGLTTVTVS